MQTTSQGNLLATDVFAWLVDGLIKTSDLPPGRYYFSSVQMFELKNSQENTPAERVRKAEILAIMHALPVLRPKSWFAPDVARCDVDPIGDTKRRAGIKAELDRRMRRPSNACDAYMIEMAIDHGLTLVTCDAHLYKSALVFGVSAHLLLKAP